MFEYEYEKADNTVDAVVFGLDEAVLKILLIERGGEPFLGCMALPGGFVEMTKDQTLEEALLRELREETGIEDAYVEQLATFGDVGRDPRGRVISTAFMMLVRPDAVKVTAGDDAATAGWYDVNHLPKLAFDHAKIIQTGLQRLRSKVRWQPVGIDLLPETFTIPELQKVYETILNHRLSKRQFYRKVKSFGVLIDTRRKAKVKTGKRGPGGRLYKFNRNKYQRLIKEGIDFEV